jgi:glycosyltransferase involved in cell wall biosynthesis
VNLLFLTIGKINDISTRGIYEDLIRKFHNEGHNVFVATPTERRYKEKTRLIQNGNVLIIKIKTLNIQKTNIIEKGLASILLEYQFLCAIKKYFSGFCFDIILYSTPPISFTKVIKYIKHKNGAISYLLLKDIFPQNAVDLGMIRQDSLLHRYFRKIEKNLYSLSDHIGCMSPANIDYIIAHNPGIKADKLEVNPNSIEPVKSCMDQKQKLILRQKYQIPLNSTVFIYGGNLGKPQGVDFLLETLYYQKEKTDVFFIVVGAGTEYPRVRMWFNKYQPKNSLLISKLAKSEFDLLLQVCDVGLIFLDRRFTIPNFPSRLLSYMEYKLPVIAATDKNTDLSKVLQENNFGLWSEAGDIISISNNIEKLTQNPLLCAKMGENGYEYMFNNYTVLNSYSAIIKHFNNKKPSNLRDFKQLIR